MEFEDFLFYILIIIISILAVTAVVFTPHPVFYVNNCTLNNVQITYNSTDNVSVHNDVAITKDNNTQVQVFTNVNNLDSWIDKNTHFNHNVFTYKNTTNGFKKYKYEEITFAVISTGKSVMSVPEFISDTEIYYNPTTHELIKYYTIDESNEDIIIGVNG